MASAGKTLPATAMGTANEGSALMNGGAEQEAVQRLHLSGESSA